MRKQANRVQKVPKARWVGWEVWGGHAWPWSLGYPIFSFKEKELLGTSSFLENHSVFHLASLKEQSFQHVDGCFQSCNLRWGLHQLKADTSFLPSAGQRLNRGRSIICERETDWRSGKYLMMSRGWIQVVTWRGYPKQLAATLALMAFLGHGNFSTFIVTISMVSPQLWFINSPKRLLFEFEKSLSPSQEHFSTYKNLTFESF